MLQQLLAARSGMQDSSGAHHRLHQTHSSWQIV
jgi:hypothetical protein